MKKTIKIAHLYYDLMNLYGENANVKAIKMFIERQGYTPEIHFLTIGDKIVFKDYDFIYIGAGSEESELLVLEDLMKYKSEINDAINDGKMFLITGNAMNLFGKKIKYLNDTETECLGIFEYRAEECEKRLVSEIAYKYDGLEDGYGKTILGFRNTITSITNNRERMFEFSNTVNRKNFYGMNFVGPFLIRNPYFTNMLVEKLLTSKNLEYTPITDTIEFKAYHEFLNNFLVNS